MLKPIDRLSTLLERFRVRTHLLFTGEMCGVRTFAKTDNKAFLHVLRRGVMEVRHARTKGVPAHLTLSEPTLIFYPRPLTHHFHNAPRDGSDFTCAEIEFEGGWGHPLAQALPPVVVLPLAQVSGLRAALDLLWRGSKIRTPWIGMTGLQISFLPFLIAR